MRRVPGSMNVLAIGQNATGYADRTHECRVMEHLAQRGHDVHFVTDDAPEWSDTEEPPEGFSYEQHPLNDAERASFIASRLSSDYDVGLATGVGGSHILAEWKQRTGNPTVATVLDVPLWRLSAGEDSPYWDAWATWFDAFLEMDTLIVNTGETRGHLHRLAKMMGTDPDNLPPIKKIYYGIDTDEADLANEDAVTFERPMEETSGIAVGVSRVVPYKGWDSALMGLSLLPDDEQPMFVIIGNGPQHEAKRLLQLQYFTGVTTAFPGGIPDFEKFSAIKNADVGIWLEHPEFKTGQFPTEAVYCGVPCVVSDHPINRERFEDHGVHYANPFDTRDVADTVQAAMDSTVSQKDQDWVKRNRSFDSYTQNLVNVLQGLA